MAGDASAELHVLPWRLRSDLDIISHDKNLMCLANFCHFICTTHGVAAFDLLDLAVNQKQHPPATVACLKVTRCGFFVGGTSL